MIALAAPDGIADFTLAHPDTGSTEFSNTNELEVLAFPEPEGYSRFQITEGGALPVDEPGAWILTNSPPGFVMFTRPPADTNVMVTVWFTNLTEQVALFSNVTEIVYTTALPEPSVRAALTRERVPGENVIIEALDIDFGSTGGNALELPMSVFDRAAVCAASNGCDLTPDEPYITLGVGTNNANLQLWLRNEAGNEITSVATCTVTVLEYSGTNYWTGEGYGDLWHDGANWSAGVPVDNQDVFMDTSAAAQLSGSTATMRSFTLKAGAGLTFKGWNSILQADTLTVEGTVTHAANDVSGTDAGGNWIPLHRIWLKGSNITVAANAVLNADYQGYPPEAGPGAGLGSGGAAHAGEGRRGFGGSVIASAYGDPAEPWQPGSGGGLASNSRPGGGSIRIEATGQLHIEGELSARGQNAAGTHGRGASGGSIWMSCHTLTGNSTGLIRVDGGNGNYYGAPGAAGRIAVHYDSDAQAALPQPSPPLRFSGKGGARTSTLLAEPLPAAMSTLYLPDTLLIEAPLEAQRFFYTRLVIPGFTNWTPTALTIDECVLGLPDGLHLDVPGNLVLTNNAGLHVFAAPVADPLTEPGAQIEVGGDLKIFSGSWLHPYADNTNGATVAVRVDGDLVIADSGGIDADYTGYTIMQGPGAPTANRGGGAYGGEGGQGYDGGRGGLAYGDPFGPMEAGSGGGTTTLGGQGGGAVRLSVGGKAEINGIISACGSPGIRNHGPGGSGGGIELNCHTFQGTSTGLLRVEGGAGSFYGGSGSGGRIVIEYDAAAQAALPQQPAVRFSAFTEPDTTHYSLSYKAEMGTLALPETLLLETNAAAPVVLDGHRFWHTRVLFSDRTSWNPVEMVLNDNVIGFAEGFQLNIAGDLTMGDGSGLNLYAEATNELYGARLDVGGNLMIDSGGWIHPHAHGAQGSIVGLFVAGNVTVASGGGIEADGKGWFPVSDNSQGDGAGKDASSGGGYGGKGGGTVGGDVYGDAAMPLAPGSPGGWRSRGGFTPSGKGGGAIHLIAGGNARLDGLLSADGYYGHYYFSPGGSGGAIFVAANTVRGTGTLRARGQLWNSTYICGGGGRIAVWTHLPPEIVHKRIAEGNVRGLIYEYPYPNFGGDLDVSVMLSSREPQAEPGTKGFYSIGGTLIILR